MQDVIDDFKERASEVASYLLLLEEFENPVIKVSDEIDGRIIPVFGETSFKVMKASAFLLIYNMVESSIRSAFNAVYAQIQNENRWFGTVAPAMRELWVRQIFRELDLDSAAPRNYRELTSRIANEVFGQAVVGLSSGKLPISGNLDADRIREVCHLHGVSVRADPKAKGGTQLATFRDLRNALAHGTISFAACGQDHSVSDLNGIHDEAVAFIESILENVRQFVDNAEYAA